MKNITCENCGHENVNEAQFCKECGASLQKSMDNQVVYYRSKMLHYFYHKFKIWKYFILLSLSMIIIFSIMIYNSYKERDKLIDNASDDLYGSVDYFKSKTWYWHSYTKEPVWNSLDDGEQKKKNLERDVERYEELRYKKDVFIIMSIIIGVINGVIVVVILVIGFLRSWYRYKQFSIPQSFNQVNEAIKKAVFLANKSSEIIKIKELEDGKLKLKDTALGMKGYFFLIKNEKGEPVLIGHKYNTQQFIRNVFGQNINFLEVK